MTRYYRSSYAPVLWGVVVSVALAAALVFAHRSALSRARVEERRTVLLEGDALLRQALAHSRVQARLIDSLTIEAARVDTVWRVAKTAAATVLAAPIPTDTAALVAAVQACRATLGATVTACDSAQAAQRAVIVAQAERARTDSAALAAHAVLTAGITRSRDAALAQLATRSKWRTLERGACAASVGLNLLTVLAK